MEAALEMSAETHLLPVTVAANAAETGRQAAAHGAALLREALASHGMARVVVATGASQLAMLDALVREPGVAWDRVTFFHLDEYLGLPVTHPASFRRYLWQRFHSLLPLPPRAFHYLDGTAPDPLEECQRMGRLISETPVDLAFLGIGENAHLAFNDPPADCTTDDPYLIVQLDEACRRQQWGEGWFSTLEEVPQQALTMSLRQILKSKALVVTVPDARKAMAVRNSLEGPLTPLVPASMLRRHSHCSLFLDQDSASLLTSNHP